MDWRGIVEHFFFLLWMRTHWRSLCKGLTCSRFVLAKNPRAPVWGSQRVSGSQLGGQCKNLGEQVVVAPARVVAGEVVSREWILDLF